MLITGTCASLSLALMSAASSSIMPCVGRRFASTRPCSDLIRGRLEVAERQLLELVLDAAHAEAVGDRRVDVERLLRDAHALVVGHVLQRAHVVEAIGELDEDDADVVDHREQHLAEVLRLPLLGRRERDRADLGHALDDVRDVLAELLADLLGRRQGVFDDVVQQAGGDADRVELHVREDVGDLERMDEVGFARMADLSLMLQGRKDIGLAEQFEVGVRAVARTLSSKSSKRIILSVCNCLSD